jgi:uncharacterized repeat protein (TIGR04138 family)
MSETQDFETLVHELCGRDPRYAEGAYHFVIEALDFTMRKLGRDQQSGVSRHVSGRELLDGIRLYTIDTFGPLATAVFRSWGIRRTDDFGTLVFRLVEAGQLSRQDSDLLEDFSQGFDFDEAFIREYEVDLGGVRV